MRRIHAVPGELRLAAGVLTLMLLACALAFPAPDALARDGPTPPTQDENLLLFKKGKDVVPFAQTAPLRKLLGAGEVKAFNELRSAPPFAGRYLELSIRGLELDLRGLDLPGVALSRCILTGADFTGSDLRGADFRMSYLVETTLYKLPAMEGGVSRGVGRPTRVDGADFTEAALSPWPGKGDDRRG